LLPKEGQIILSNLLSGEYKVLVYYHDGKSYNAVANLVLKLLDLGIYLLMILLALIMSFYIFIINGIRCVISKKIKRRGLKASKNDSRNGIES
jgi:hypothetical protein